jgi:hypothetical protein
MAAFADTRRNEPAWIAKVGFCSGLAIEAADDGAAAAAAWDTLDRFNRAEQEVDDRQIPRWWRTVRRRARLLLGSRSGGPQ